jgi:hypothetical protein
MSAITRSGVPQSGQTHLRCSAATHASSHVALGTLCEHILVFDPTTIKPAKKTATPVAQTAKTENRCRRVMARSRDESSAQAAWLNVTRTGLQSI